MIGIDGQYLLAISVGDKKDFIEETHLDEFKTVESAGGALPEFSLYFSTTDESILRRMNESNDIKIQFGKNRELLTETEVIPLTMKTQRLAPTDRGFEVSGTLSASKYMSETNVANFGRKSAVASALEVAKKHFTIAGNITKSLDSQVWFQPNITDRKFIMQTLLHGDYGNSFCPYGISFDKKFIIKDVKKDIGRKPDWRFTSQGQNSNDIIYNSDPVFISRHGLINQWIGNGQLMDVYNSDSGNTSEVLERAEPMLALADKLSRRQELEPKYVGMAYQNDNVHPNYHKAYQKNLAYLASYSAYTLRLSFTGSYHPIQLLDLVMFKEPTTDSSKKEAIDHISGLYYVTRISRVVSLKTKKVTTVVDISREAINQAKTVK